MYTQMYTCAVKPLTGALLSCRTCPQFVAYASTHYCSLASSCTTKWYHMTDLAPCCCRPMPRPSALTRGPWPRLQPLLQPAAAAPAQPQLQLRPRLSAWRPLSSPKPLPLLLPVSARGNLHAFLWACGCLVAWSADSLTCTPICTTLSARCCSTQCENRKALPVIPERGHTVVQSWNRAVGPAALLLECGTSLPS